MHCLKSQEKQGRLCIDAFLSTTSSKDPQSRSNDGPTQVVIVARVEAIRGLGNSFRGACA